MYAVSALDRARHELGHHFIGRHLGFAMGDVSIEPLEGGLAFIGGTSYIDTSRAITSMSEFEKWCEDRICVLYAGVLAQSLIHGFPDNEKAISLTKDFSGYVDCQMVSQLLNILRNIRYFDCPPSNAEMAIKSDEEALWNKTRKFVENHAAEIEAVASGFSNSLKMTRAEIDAHPSVKASIAPMPVQIV